MHFFYALPLTGAIWICIRLNTSFIWFLYACISIDIYFISGLISCLLPVSALEKFLSQHLPPATANICGAESLCKSAKIVANPLLPAAGCLLPAACPTKNKNSNNNKCGCSMRLEEEDDSNAWVMPIAMVKWWSGSAPTPTAAAAPAAPATTNPICIAATGRVIAVKKPAGRRNVLANVWTNINMKVHTRMCVCVCACAAKNVAGKRICLNAWIWSQLQQTQEAISHYVFP